MKHIIRNMSIGILSAFILAAISGCSAKTSDNEKVPEENTLINETDAAKAVAVTEEAAPEKEQIKIVLEAETQQLVGNVYVESKKEGYSGDGYVTGFTADGDACSFLVKLEKEGFYDINFISAAESGEKDNYCIVDGESVGTVHISGTVFGTSIIERVYLAEGEHTISFSKYWGYSLLDRIELTESKELPKDLFEVSAKLINPAATDNAKRLMKYMTDIYGKQILTGQYCDTGMFGMENAAIWRTTGGEFPAVLGLDLMGYTPSMQENGSTSKATDYAAEYWEAGGIVTFCWHWNAPAKYLTGTWYKGFYTDSTNIDLKKIMNGEDTEGYELLMKDIDAIAKQLLILQDKGVPILFRPLHEASGGWFWWGASGAEPYKQLWKLLYDKLTNEYGCNNLIWIWNGQAADWYPGDEYCDIIGEDIYPGEKVYTSQVGKFCEVLDYTSARKLIVMSENGCIFDPDLAVRDGAMWGFYATWGGDFVLKNPNTNILSETYTEEAMVKKVYTSDIMINRSELPDLKNYPFE